MRIHHVIASVLEIFGGPSITVPTLCRELTARGHEVTLHVLAPGPEPAGFKVQAYHRSRLAFRFGLSRDLFSGLRHAAQHGDIVHVHGLWMLPNILPALAVAGTNCRLVASPRGMLDEWALQQSSRRKRLLWSLGQGQALRAADVVHTTADSEMQAARAQGVRAPIAIIPNGVAIPDDADVATFDTRPRVLLFLSRVHPKKGVDLLLRAWLQLQAAFPEWELRIVGPGADGYPEAMRALARELGTERVQFAGPAYGPDKVRLFREAQAYVLPTHAENFGLGIAEALATGLPAIVGRGAPWPELAAKGCGYWVDNEPTQLANCLREVLSKTPAQLQAMGAIGRTWMRSEFAWSERARDMEALYTWLLRPDTPRPATLHELPELQRA